MTCKMEQRQLTFSFEQTRAIDLVSYLAGIGYHPVKIRGNDFWYLSPLRKESTPSFKINRRINRWYDFGSGSGGSIIDFGMAYYGCSLADFMQQLWGTLHLKPLPLAASLVSEVASDKITVLKSIPLTSSLLVGYLVQRKIPLDIAEPFCKQVHFRVGRRSFWAIGFQNDCGGYELRNTWFKGSSSPKAITSIRRNQDTLCIFEGFFDFLSFLVLFPAKVSSADFLILNGLSLFEKARPVMEPYPSIKLFLDNNPAGKVASTYALSLGSQFQNQDHLYDGYDDLNDLLCNKPFFAGANGDGSIRPP